MQFRGSRAVTTLLSVLLTASLAMSPVAAVATFEGAPVFAQSQDTELSPGERLRAVVGVQEAEVDGELEGRSFAISFRNSSSNLSRAGVIAGEVETINARLAALERQKQRLRAARDNGTISEGQFRARMAVVAARTNALERVANQTARATRTVPDRALERQGVNRTAVRQLSNRASNLTGQEVAAIVRSIGGKNANRPLNAGNRPNATGPPDGVPGNGPPDRGGGNDSEPGNSGSNSGNGNAANGSESNGTGPNELDGDSVTWLSDGERTATPGWGGFRADRSAPLVSQENGQSEAPPLFAVAVREDGSADVVLQMTFDLETTSDQQAFETLQSDEQARIDVRNRYRDRLRKVANTSQERVKRDMRVHDAGIELTTVGNESIGLVSVSVAWDGLAAVRNEHLVITEPFASGFTPSREFRVRIVVPDRYRMTTVTPSPAVSNDTSAAWEAGTSLDNFTLAFAPEGKTPLPEDAIDEYKPQQTPADEGSGFGTGVALAALILLVGIAVAAYRYRD